MMDQESDIAGAKARMPVQPIPDITKEVLQAHNERERGCQRKNTSTVTPVLKACAEDELVTKEYKELRCEIPGLTKSTFLMVFSPDGTKMASTHGNHNVYITDLRTGKNIKTLVGHPRTPWCVAFHPSSNQILASGCLGGQVRIWDLSGGSEVWTAESQTVISSLAFHPIDRLLVIATYNELYFWDWSQPKPFMQTSTSNAKEKVRYVAFDRLGHKLITGIANTPQGFTRWERVRAPVPVARHSDRIAAYRRRITPRLVPPVSHQLLNSNPPESPNQNSIPERERRIAVCYRNLVEQYEMLVHRYLEAYRPATTIDRGTDPMEAEHLASSAASPAPVVSAEVSPLQPPATSAASTASTQTSSAQTNAPSTSRDPPASLPGPSGLSRQSASRPNKRSNAPGTKSDSSTVYQSDSSSSSSSDESPTPKRRISLVPNSNMFRNKSETTAPATKNVKEPSTSTRKKLFMSRPSAFHLTRSSSSQSSQNISNFNRFIDSHLNARSSVDNRPTPPRNRISDRILTNMYPPAPSPARLEDLPFPLGRLRGISEGSLSSADEVINFSERPMNNREEPEVEPAENFTPDLPTESEFPQQAAELDNLYSHILNDLETSLREARNSSRPETTRSSDPSNLLASFSERLENIMNQSDAILANLRRSMEMLMEPTTQPQNNNNNNQSSTTPTTNNPPTPSQSLNTPSSSQTNPSTSTESSSSARRIFILRKPSGFHAHNRQCLPRCSGTSRSNNQSGSNSQTYPGSSFTLRGNRYVRIRQPRLNVRPPGSNSSVWRPFDDHSYPRDPDQGGQDSGQRSNVEPIRSLLTLSPRSPSAGAEVEETQEETVPVEQSSTPVPFPTSEHNYPLPEPPPSTSEPPEISPLNENPIADHTYPRDPQNSTNNAHSSDYIAPLVSSLHSTISHISMQTNLLRRQVESIEMIDRARFEVFQLQELRRMWEEIRRHLNVVNSATSERRSNMTNVRQMMAWARISDPSPSSESGPSSTEQSTPEPSPSVPERPMPSTSRSSASSSNESRPQSSSYLNRFRHCHIKKRMYWRRRSMKNDNAQLNLRRYFRGHSYRDLSSRSARSELPGRNDLSHSSEGVISVMIRRLEHLLSQQSFLLGRRDAPSSPDRISMEYRVQSERVIQNQLRAARQTLNRVNGQTNTTNVNYLEDPVEHSSLNSRNDWVRYETRLRLSEYAETLSRFIESHSNNIPQALNDQIKVMLELAVLLTDILLLQIMESIPSLSGSILDPERESLSQRITQMCTNMLQNHNNLRSASLIRVLHELRVNTRSNTPSNRIPPRRNNNNERTIENTTNSSNTNRSRARELVDLNRQLRRLYQFSNYLNDPDPFPAPLPPSAEPNPSTSTENSMSHVYRLGDLLARLRSVRGRLEQVSQSALAGRVATGSSSTTEPEPTRSTDESPSDRESEPFEGFQSQWDQPLHDASGSLYRTQHINLYPPDPPSSSQSSPERVVQTGGARPWNVPTVQVNDVPVAEVLPPQPRIWLHRYPSDLRPLSAATGLFRPRFLIPLYAGVNPFDADLDDPQREGPIGYDGIMTTTVSPNHRIQMWDISKSNIPNISNHEKNIVVSECKIHNDGSVDISSDGTLLVTLLPSGGYLNVTNRLGIYSIKWDTLGQCLYTTSFEQNAISVSLSPLSRHLIVGLASRRVTLLPSDRWTMARIFLLDDRKVKFMGRGRLVVLRDLEQGRDRDLNFMSVNCIKWMPMSGQGIVYATNTGQLKVLT